LIGVIFPKGTSVEILRKVIAKAASLADLPMADLRRMAMTSDSGSQYAANQELQGLTRGQLVERILLTTFETYLDESKTSD
jgi:hypothetical protein